MSRVERKAEADVLENPSLPTFDELRRLPLWACVALGGRCICRVKWMWSFVSFGNTGSKWVVGPLIEFICNSAARATVDPQEAASVGRSFEEMISKHPNQNLRSAPIVVATNHAFNAAVVAGVHEGDKVATLVGMAAEAIVSIVHDKESHPIVIDAIRRDYELLCEVATLEGWTSDTQVPQELFGPYWPEGEAPRPMDSDAAGDGEAIVFQIEVPDDATDAEVISKVNELVAQADSLHRAYGGHGLQVESLSAYDRASVSLGVNT